MLRMGDPYNHQKKMIESEMDRFEQEISSLAPTTMARSFIPAQLRRPMGHGHSNPMPPGTGSSHHHHNIPPPPPSQLVVKPSPVIIRYSGCLWIIRVCSISQTY